MRKQDKILDYNIYWTNKEGKKLLITEITDIIYLQNIIKTLIRQKERDEYFDFMDIGDMQDCF